MQDITFEQVVEFYEFLQGDIPKEILIKYPPRLSQRKAFNIIWYLQEHLGIIPNNYERCCSCGELYDINNSGGIYRNRCYCSSCFGGKI